MLIITNLFHLSSRSETGELQTGACDPGALTKRRMKSSSEVQGQAPPVDLAVGERDFFASGKLYSFTRFC